MEIRRNRLRFDIALVCEKGERPVNEDTVAVEQGDGAILFAIADGLGAHGGGDIASQTAIQAATETFLRLRWPSVKALWREFQNINDAVLGRQDENIQMKTTLACVLYRRKRLYLAHVGDTRVYIFREGKITGVTADHSFSYDEVMREGGTLDDIRRNPHRHILRAALGVKGSHRPDTAHIRATPGLALLLCSDGFWQYVDEHDMQETFSDDADAAEWLARMLARHAAKAERFHDNYSAICVRIRK